MELGIYRHYKGTQYEVFAVGKLEDTLQEMAVYRSLRDGNEVWVRPISAFYEEIEFEGKWVPRFELIDESSESND